MQTRILSILTLGLSLAACAEAEKGTDGADGEDGTAGAAGVDGNDGDPGADGEDGEDDDGDGDGDGDGSPCAGATPVEITGLTGLPTEAMTAYYASDSITVESNAAGDLSYAVSGYGLDYEWSGDSFTVTPTTDMPSSQVIIATDGCTTDTFEFSVDAKVGNALLNIVHLYEGAPSVDVTLSGDAIEDAILTDFTFVSQTNYLETDARPYAFDLWVEGAVAATTDTIELMDQGTYTLVVYSDGGAPATLLIEDDLSELSAADSTRITAIHVADGIGQVDVWETVLGVALFEDLDFGAVSEAIEITSDADYTVGLDVDDDGAADQNFETITFSGLEDQSANVFAFSQSGLPFLFASIPTLEFGARLFPDPLPAPSSIASGTSTPALPVPDYPGSFVGDTITITDTCTVLTVEVDVDISHTYRGDLEVVLAGPDGTEIFLHDQTGTSANDVIGTYSSDGSGTLVPAGDLNDFLLLQGTGDWTLSAADFGYGDIGTINAWGINIGCL
ncbi:MAG TPA: hypothetical protein DFR83_04530 [Deltaproteobacteria bacterium]|nr:hypothetical protein [Deltaproteobacteria bacterium]